MGGKIMCVLHANEFQTVNRGYSLSHMNENMYIALLLVFISIQMMKHTSSAIIKYLIKDKSYFKTNALLFRVLCNILHTIIVIEKVQFWDDAFLAVVGIKINPDYFHVHKCKHNTTKSNIDLFAINVCPLHLVKVGVIYLECCVTSC